MSKNKKKVITTTVKKAEPTVSKKAASPSTVASSFDQSSLVFNKTNFLLMIGGIVLIALGLFLMSGGAMPSPDVWDEDIIYSFRRTVLAPLVIIAGLVLEIYAIFKKDTQAAAAE